MADNLRPAVNPKSVARRLSTVGGAAVPGKMKECAVVWRPGTDDLFSAVYLGGRFLLTALHAVPLGDAGDYHVSLPVDSIGDMRPGNCFRVVHVHRNGPPGVDLAILEFSNESAQPLVDGASIATAADLPSSAQMELCGFGGDCSNPVQPGDKRMSVPLALVKNGSPLIPRVNPAIAFALAGPDGQVVACDSDSGGGAFVMSGDTGKLAGIISETVQDASGRPFTACTRILPALDWIRRVTRLALPS